MEARRQVWTDWATVLTGLVAALSLIFGSIQFTRVQALEADTQQLQAETLDHERNAQAVDLFVKFNEIQRGVEQSSSGGGQPATSAVPSTWDKNILLAITESVFLLTPGDSGWEATVGWMLKKQLELEPDLTLECPTFATEFVRLVHDAIGHDPCG